MVSHAADALDSPTESAQGALSLLADLSRAFADSPSVEQTVRAALDRIVAHVGAEAGSLFLLGDAGDAPDLTCRACVGEPDITGFRVPHGAGIVGHSVRENQSSLVRDVSADPHFHAQVDEATGFTTRSIICAPLSVKDECLGAIELLNKRDADGRFSAGDLHLLEVLAASAALAILNARMAERLVDQERLRRELELAAEIQRGLLPPRPPAGFPVFGVNVPVRQVSGDFYDFFALEDGRIGFCLGDVSGKGMNAALLMAKTQSLYRCLGRHGERPGRLLGALNREICETASLGMFVTMVGGVLDPDAGRVWLANAGHEPPLLHAGDGAFRDFPAEQPPLGVLPDPTPDGCFPECEIDLDGGALYVFSDGLTEARGADGAPLEVAGVRNALAAAAGLPLAERLERVVAGAAGTRHDDLTLLGVEARSGA